MSELKLKQSYIDEQKQIKENSLNENQPKKIWLGILALIFAFKSPIIGIILSVIVILKKDRYNETYGIVALVFSIAMLVIMSLLIL